MSIWPEPGTADECGDEVISDLKLQLLKMK